MTAAVLAPVVFTPIEPTACDRMISNLGGLVPGQVDECRAPTRWGVSVLGKEPHPRCPHHAVALAARTLDLLAAAVTS